MPSVTKVFTSPLAVAASAAGELPVADNAASPLTSPSAVCITGKVGNNCLSFRCRACSENRPLSGTPLPSRWMFDASVPPATPKFSGLSVSTPSCITRWVDRSVIGRLAVLTMRRPVNRTSASIFFQRSVRNVSTGNALFAGCATAAPRRALLAFVSAPMSGARSENCSSLDSSVPDNNGLGSRDTYTSVPPRSLPPTRPVKFSYLKTFPDARNWPTSRPSVA